MKPDELCCSKKPSASQVPGEGEGRRRGWVEGEGTRTAATECGTHSGLWVIKLQGQVFSLWVLRLLEQNLYSVMHFYKNREHFPGAPLCRLLPHPSNVTPVCTFTQLRTADPPLDSNTLPSDETGDILGQEWVLLG